MPNEVPVKQNTQLRFAVAGSFGPGDPGTNWSAGTPTDVALSLSGILNGDGRQSDKVDLGAVRAARFACLGCVDLTGATATIGNTVDYYWAPSTSGTQDTGNVAGNSGADAAAPGGALGGITLDEFIAMCQHIGHLTVHDGSVVQNGFVGVFSPSERYGQLIVVNNSGATFAASNAEAHQILVPIMDEIQ